MLHDEPRFDNAPRPYMRSALIVGAILFAACGGGSAGSGPETVVRQSISALNQGDVKAIIGASVSPDRLGKALACAQKPSIVDQVGTRVTYLQQRPDAFSGMHVELSALTDLQLRTLAKGEKFHDCTTNESFDVASYRVMETIDDHGMVTHAGKDGEAIRLDGHWYVLEG